MKPAWLTLFGGTLLVKIPDWVRIGPHYALRPKDTLRIAQWTNVEAWKALAALDLVAATARVSEVFRPLSFVDYDVSSISKILYS